MRLGQLGLFALCPILVHGLQGAAQLPVIAGQPTQANQPAHTDLYGDPLPEGAIARMGTVRFRTSGNVTALAFTKGGQQLIALDNGTVQIWNAADGRLLKQLTPPAGTLVDCLAVSGNGRWLAGGDRDGSLWLWSLDDLGKSPQRWLGPRYRLTAVAFSQDSRQLASVSEDDWRGHVRLWDVATGKVRAESSADSNDPCAITFSPDGKHVVSGDRKGAVRLWDVPKQYVTGLQASGVPIRNLQVTADGSTVLALVAHAYQGCTLQRWDLAHGKALPALEYLPETVDAFALSTDGRHLAGSSDTTVYLCETATGKVLRKLTSPVTRVYQLAFSPDGKRLAGATGHRLCMWDVASGEELLPTQAHQQAAQFVRVLPDGKTVLSMDHAQVHFWNAGTGKLVRTFRCPDVQLATAVDLSPDGKVLAVADSPRGGVLVDVATGKKRTGWSEKSVGNVERLTFSPDGKLLAVADDKYFTAHRLLDTTTAKVVHDFGESPIFMRQLFFSPDGKHLVATGYNHAHVWDMATRQKQHVLKDHGPALFFLPASNNLAFATVHSGQFALGLLDLEKMGPLRVLPHYAPMTILAISPGGHLTVHRSSRPGDGSISLRAVNNGKCLLRLAGHLGGVQTLAFAPDDGYLVTAGADATLLVWDLKKALEGKRPAVVLKEAELKALWSDLASGCDDIMIEVIDRLVESPASTLAWLKQQVKPVSTTDLDQWIADLDSNVFAKREKASHQLAQMGPAAVESLQHVLDGKPSLELRLRVELVLKKLDGPVPPQVVASWRAVIVLEQINTPEARDLLEALAKGSPAARLTRDAQAALQRLSIAGDREKKEKS
jgi:WD40 repeat protein